MTEESVKPKKLDKTKRVQLGNLVIRVRNSTLNSAIKILDEELAKARADGFEERDQIAQEERQERLDRTREGVNR